jgi:hypothetical protein
MSHKDAASIQRAPIAPSSTQVSPPISVPAGVTLKPLSYRDVAASGASPSDSEGFLTVTYKKVASTTPTAENAAAGSKITPRRQPLIGVRNSLALPVIAKPERSKALFVSRFSPEVTAEDVEKSLKEQLSFKMLVCTRLRTKYNSYASFHISVTEDEFPLINSTVTVTCSKDSTTLYCTVSTLLCK